MAPQDVILFGAVHEHILFAPTETAVWCGRQTRILLLFVYFSWVKWWGAFCTLLLWGDDVRHIIIIWLITMYSDTRNDKAVPSSSPSKRAVKINTNTGQATILIILFVYFAGQLQFASLSEGGDTSEFPYRCRGFYARLFRRAGNVARVLRFHVRLCRRASWNWLRISSLFAVSHKNGNR